MVKLHQDQIIKNVNMGIKELNTLKKIEEIHKKNTKDTLILEHKIMSALNNKIRRIPQQNLKSVSEIKLNEIKLNDKNINESTDFKKHEVGGTRAKSSESTKSAKKVTGTYVAVDYTDTSVNTINAILKSLGVKKNTEDPFHTTIAYSTKPFPFSPKTCLSKRRTRKFVPKNNNKVIITDLDLFDNKTLILKIDAPFCEAEFIRTKKAGAVYDYDKYIPHITLATLDNDSNFDLNKFKQEKPNILKKIIGTRLILKDEYIEKLNPNK